MALSDGNGHSVGSLHPDSLPSEQLGPRVARGTIPRCAPRAPNLPVKQSENSARPTERRSVHHLAIPIPECTLGALPVETSQLGMSEDLFNYWVIRESSRGDDRLRTCGIPTDRMRNAVVS